MNIKIIINDLFINITIYNNNLFMDKYRSSTKI